MIIKILGSGCANCRRLEKNVRQAIKTLGIDASVEKVTGIKEITAYGVTRTPALVVDEQVKVSGRVASEDEIIKLLQ